MKGQILDFNTQTNSGNISGSDGNRYSFSGEEWKSNEAPTRGRQVDFISEDGKAKDIFLAVGNSGEPSKIANTILEYLETAMKFFNKFSNVVLFVYSAILLVIGVVELFDSVDRSSHKAMLELYDTIWNAFAYILIWLALFAMRAATSVKPKK